VITKEQCAVNIEAANKTKYYTYIHTYIHT